MPSSTSSVRLAPSSEVPAFSERYVGLLGCLGVEMKKNEKRDGTGKGQSR